MSILGYSVLWLLLFLSVLSATLFALRRANLVSIPREFSLADVANLIAVLFAVFSLAFAIASFEDAAKSSEQQQQTLDSSKDALLQAVELAKSHQEALAESVDLSKEQMNKSQDQVRLLTAASDALKAQLELATEQMRNEKLRASQKPKIKMVFDTATGDDDDKEIRGGFTNPFFFGVEIYNVGSSNVVEPEVDVSAGCVDKNGDFVPTYLSRWNPQPPGPGGGAFPIEKEHLGPVLLHDEHVFVISKLHHGGYDYSYRVRCEEGEMENLDYLHITAEVSGENIETVSRQLKVTVSERKAETNP